MAYKLINYKDLSITVYRLVCIQKDEQILAREQLQYPEVEVMQGQNLLGK